MFVKEYLFDLHHQRLRHAISTTLYIFSILLYAVKLRKTSIKLALKSNREHQSSSNIKLLKKILEKDIDIVYQLTSTVVSISEAAGRSIVLSNPSVTNGRIMKGVLLIKFTHTFSFYLEEPRFTHLNKYYTFVLEPSWAGYADADILSFLMKADSCIIQATEISDRILISTLMPKVRVVQFGSGNWVDPEIFSESHPIELDGTKDFDFIYVANMNIGKRVLRALKAVKVIKDEIPNFKALIVCASWGADTLRQKKQMKFIADNSLSNNVSIIAGVPQRELAKLISKSKVSLLLSYKEGSNRAIFESMLTNTPALLVSENIGSNKSYVNELTGLIVKDCFLEDSLKYFYNHWDTFSPSDWARDNVTPEATIKKLSNTIEVYSRGATNHKIVAKCNSPELTYMNRKIESVSKELLEVTNKRSINYSDLPSISTG